MQRALQPKAAIQTKLHRIRHEGGHSPSPFPPSLLGSQQFSSSAHQFDFTSGDEASFGSTPSGPSFANQPLFSLAAATSSDYPTSGCDMSGAGFTSSPSSSAAELPPYLPLSNFPSGPYPTPLSGADCPSPGGNQPDSGKWRLGDPGKATTMNSMPTPSVSLSSKAHASLAASSQLSASSDGRDGLMESGQTKFEGVPSNPLLQCSLPIHPLIFLKWTIEELGTFYR